MLLELGPIYKATSSSFALERDALGHLYPEIVEDPNLRFDFEIEEAAFAYNPFADITLGYPDLD